MKHLSVIACLLLFTSVVTISKTPLHVEAINIDMNGDILYATSDNPDDPMKQIRVFNSQGQQVAYRKCMTGLTCTLDLSAQPSGIYLAVANSVQLQYSENVFVE